MPTSHFFPNYMVCHEECNIKMYLCQIRWFLKELMLTFFNSNLRNLSQHWFWYTIN